MEYYGNNDWRNYLKRQDALAHYGVAKKSGRYPWGSGEDPYHHGADAPGGKKKKRLRDFTQEDNERVRKAASRFGVVGGFAEIAKIKREAERTEKAFKTDVDNAKIDKLGNLDDWELDFTDKADKDKNSAAMKALKEKVDSGSATEFQKKSYEKGLKAGLDDRTISTSKDLQKELGDLGYKHSDIVYGGKNYGSESVKSVTTKNSKGNDQKIDIHIDSADRDLDKEVSSKELKTVLKDMEDNWSSYDKLAREQIVKEAYEGPFKPWAYDDVNLSLDEAKKDYYKRIGTDGKGGEKYVYVKVYPSDMTGYLSYEDGDTWYGHVIEVDFDFKNKKAGRVSIEG